MAAQLAGRTFDMTTVHRFTDPEYAGLTVRMRNGEHPASLFDRLHTLGSRPAPTMKLEFLFIPTADLGASLALYREPGGATIQVIDQSTEAEV